MCSVCGQLSGRGQGIQAHAVSERALVPWSAYVFGVQPRLVQVDPHLRLLGTPEGNVFLRGGQQSAAL